MKQLFMCFFICILIAGCDHQEGQSPIPAELSDALEVNTKTPGIFVVLQCPKKNARFTKYFGYRSAFVIPNQESTGWLNAKDCGDTTKDIRFGFFSCDWRLQERLQGGAKRDSSGTLKENEFKMPEDAYWSWVELSASPRSKQAN